MGAMRKDIEFSTVDHVSLRGWFYPPPTGTGKPSPCIIMTNGLGGVKEQFLPDFAERFQAAGYGVIVYDHRNWGASDGSPREESDPWQHALDYSDAFDFAASLPEIDSSKIVFWGNSMSGGSTICASAFDKRIRAAIAQVPFISGEAFSGVLAKYMTMIYNERQSLKSGNRPEKVQVFAQNSQSAMSPDCPALLNEPGFIPFLKELEHRGIRWEGRTTIQTLHYLQRFEPMSFIHRIAPTPFLMIVADNDVAANTSVQLKAYSMALEPKRIAILHETAHFDPYFGPSFEKNIKVQLEFLADVFDRN